MCSLKGPGVLVSSLCWTRSGVTPGGNVCSAGQSQLTAGAQHCPSAELPLQTKPCSPSTPPLPLQLQREAAVPAAVHQLWNAPELVSWREGTLLSSSQHPSGVQVGALHGAAPIPAVLGMSRHKAAGTGRNVILSRE